MAVLKLARLLHLLDKMTGRHEIRKLPNIADLSASLRARDSACRHLTRKRSASGHKVHRVQKFVYKGLMPVEKKDQGVAWPVKKGS